MSTVVDKTSCSGESLARNDPMYGTASAGFAWVMLELPGPWGHSAFLQSPTIIDPQLGRSIVRRVESAKMRITAIRRHGRRSKALRWRWFIARSTVGEEALYHGEVDDPRDYLELALDGSDGVVTTDPMVAVCAHGKHDQCCAVRGRSAVAAIAQAYPDLTWECSHLGGDRFAATMLVLPEGLCYGRADAPEPADLIRLYLEGRVDNSRLRGRTSLPHVVQAAQYFARDALGDDAIAAWLPVHVEAVDGATRVVLQRGDGTVEVVVGERFSEPLMSKCGATTGRVREFTLVSLG
jgi:hypothetical protein